MKLPMPCDCVVQNVDIDGKPPIFEQGQSLNNSIVQSVNINTPRGKLTEWFLIIILTVFLAVVLFLGFFMVSKSSIKSYLSFVQNTIQSMEPQANKETFTTNVVTLPVAVTNLPLGVVTVPTNSIQISAFRWRLIDDSIHLQYTLKNVSTNRLTDIKLDVNTSPIIKIMKDVDELGEPTILEQSNVKTSNVIIPIGTNQITNVSIRVSSIKKYE